MGIFPRHLGLFCVFARGALLLIWGLYFQSCCIFLHIKPYSRLIIFSSMFPYFISCAIYDIFLGYISFPPYMFSFPGISHLSFSQIDNNVSTLQVQKLDTSHICLFQNCTFGISIFILFYHTLFPIKHIHVIFRNSCSMYSVSIYFSFFPIIYKWFSSSLQHR